MGRWKALLGTAVFVVVMPLPAAVGVPWLLTRWEAGPPWLGQIALNGVGVALIAGASLVLLDAWLRFALQGLGTPAPVAPTRHLVVGGLYRHVRNPMYVAILALVLGQALLLASLAVLAYAVALWVVFHAFVRLYEEPTLRRSFGADYERFCAHVPRWLPRLRPWRDA